MNYEFEDIKEILKAFDGSKATKIELKNEKGEQLMICQQQTKPVAVDVIKAEPVYEETAVKTEVVSMPESVTKAEGTPVTSPMVGVFYAAPAPDKEPYVSVGSKVNKGDVLCLIEAMKLMNEVTAEKSGEIVEVCVENGQVVEYGQPLFMIK